MRLKCTNWKRYRAIRKPSCGCKYCNDLWKSKQSNLTFKEILDIESKHSPLVGSKKV